MVINPNSDKHIEFDQSLLDTIQPSLAAAEGYKLSTEELRSIFGIDATHFTPIPKRLAVPKLYGTNYTQSWYRVRGWLYVLEPKEWVPVVRVGDAIAASKLAENYSQNIKRLSETSFNAECMAKVSWAASASYCGVTASGDLSSEYAFNYNNTRNVEELLGKNGIVGDEEVQLLHVYPVLRCKAVERQRIDYTINGSGEEMEWGKNSFSGSDENAIGIVSTRLERVSHLQLHPVPMSGDGLGQKTYMLPVPQISLDGRLQFTTLLRREGWNNWYIYENDFHACSMTVDLAAPENNAAFRPTSGWITIEASIQSAFGGMAIKEGDKKGKKGGKVDSEHTNSREEDAHDGKKKSKSRRRSTRKRKENKKKESSSSHSSSSSDENESHKSPPSHRAKEKKGKKKRRNRDGRSEGIPEGAVICALTPPEISD